jgi:hypothetical protein
MHIAICYASFDGCSIQKNELNRVHLVLSRPSKLGSFCVLRCIWAMND